jgi:hypothetical protein
MNDDETRAYLRDNGYPEHIVRGGTAGLVKRWKDFVDEVERGYEFGLEEYRNDLDIRGVIRLVGSEEEVADADRRFLSMLTGTDARVWESGEGNPPWDFGYPRNAPRRLLSDLRAAGLCGDFVMGQDGILRGGW